MTDLLAGTEVLAQDVTPTQYTFEGTLQSNINSSGYSEPTNPCRVSFIAPTTGRVKIIVGGGGEDDSGDGRVRLAPEVHENDINGETVMSPNSLTNGYISMGEASAFHYHCRVSILDGLTPGMTYFARLMVTGGTTSDLRNKNLIVVPVP